MPLLLSIFLTFFKIGCFSFGGGYGMVSLMQHEVIEAHGWLTAEEFTDILAVAASAPGALAVNSATFVGYRLAGVPGAVAGTLGVAMPSFIIILVIAGFLMQYKEHPTVKAVFQGLQPAIIALIAAAAFKLGHGQHFAGTEFLIMLVVFACVTFLKINPIWAVIGAGLLGALLFR